MRVKLAPTWRSLHDVWIALPPVCYVTVTYGGQASIDRWRHRGLLYADTCTGEWSWKMAHFYALSINTISVVLEYLLSLALSTKLCGLLALGVVHSAVCLSVSFCPTVPPGIIVTVFGRGIAYRYVTSHPGQLSLLPSVGREMSTGQSAVMRWG